MGTRRYALAHCDRVIQYSKSMRTYTCLFNLAFVAGEMQAVYKDALHVPRPCLAVYCTEAAWCSAPSRFAPAIRSRACVREHRDGARGQRDQVHRRPRRSQSASQPAGRRPFGCRPWALPLPIPRTLMSSNVVTSLSAMSSRGRFWLALQAICNIIRPPAVIISFPHNFDRLVLPWRPWPGPSSLSSPWVLFFLSFELVEARDCDINELEKIVHIFILIRIFFFISLTETATDYDAQTPVHVNKFRVVLMHYTGTQKSPQNKLVVQPPVHYVWAVLARDARNLHNTARHGTLAWKHTWGVGAPEKYHTY